MNQESITIALPVATTVAIAIMALALVNIGKSKVTLLPTEYRALAASVLTFVGSAATLLAMGYQPLVAIGMALTAAPLPAGIHENTTKPGPTTKPPTEVKIVDGGQAAVTNNVTISGDPAAIEAAITKAVESMRPVAP